MKWIADRYRVRIKRIMESIREVLIEAGYHCDDVWEDDGDYYSWSFLCEGKEKTPEEREAGTLNENTDIDFRFIIAESEYWDGSKHGVNFMLDIVAVGGLIVGGLAPYNYTNEVWVERGDRQAVRERFQIMQDADVTGIPDIIAEFLAQQEKWEKVPH